MTMTFSSAWSASSSVIPFSPLFTPGPAGQISRTRRGSKEVYAYYISSSVIPFSPLFPKARGQIISPSPPQQGILNWHTCC
jgi:hypothetical protein